MVDKKETGETKETTRGRLQFLNVMASVQNNEKSTSDSEEYEAKKTKIERGEDEEAKQPI